MRLALAWRASNGLHREVASPQDRRLRCGLRIEAIVLICSACCLRRPLVFARLHVTVEGLLRMASRTRNSKAAKKSSRDKVRAYRDRMRRQGLRPIQIWVPDVRSPEFAKEAHRQSLAVAKSPHAKEDQDFIDAISDWGDE